MSELQQNSESYLPNIIEKSEAIQMLKGSSNANLASLIEHEPTSRIWDMPIQLPRGENFDVSHLQLITAEIKSEEQNKLIAFFLVKSGINPDKVPTIMQHTKLAMANVQNALSKCDGCSAVLITDLSNLNLGKYDLSTINLSTQVIKGYNHAIINLPDDRFVGARNVFNGIMYKLAHAMGYSTDFKLTYNDSDKFMANAAIAIRN